MEKIIARILFAIGWIFAICGGILGIMSITSFGIGGIITLGRNLAIGFVIIGLSLIIRLLSEINMKLDKEKQARDDQSS